MEGFVPEGCVSILFGYSDIGKSFILRYMLLCIASGRSFFGRRVKRSRVLYLECYQSPNTDAAMLDTLLNRRKKTMNHEPADLRQKMENAIDALRTARTETAAAEN